MLCFNLFCYILYSYQIKTWFFSFYSFFYFTIDLLIDWCLTPTLAIFQLHVHCGIILLLVCGLRYNFKNLTTTTQTASCICL
jgi:cytochrome b561